MMLGVQEMVQSHVLSETSVFRIPCIAYVIQLSLKDLLGKIKAHPTNKEAESEWPNARMQSLQTNSWRLIRDIMITLKKVSISPHSLYDNTHRLSLDSRARCLYQC